MCWSYFEIYKSNREIRVQIGIHVGFGGLCAWKVMTKVS